MEKLQEDLSKDEKTSGRCRLIHKKLHKVTHQWSSPGQHKNIITTVKFFRHQKEGFLREEKEQLKNSDDTSGVTKHVQMQVY